MIYSQIIKQVLIDHFMRNRLNFDLNKSRQSVCFKSNAQRPTKSSKFNTTTAPFTCKLSMAIRLMKYTLAVNLVLLSNDVETQPGPIYQTPNLNCSNVSYSSSMSSGSASSPCSNDDGSEYTDRYIRTLILDYQLLDYESDIGTLTT